MTTTALEVIKARPKMVIRDNGTTFDIAIIFTISAWFIVLLLAIALYIRWLPYHFYIAVTGCTNLARVIIALFEPMEKTQCTAK